MLTLALSSLSQTVTNVVCFGDGLAGDCSMFIDEFCGDGSPVSVSRSLAKVYTNDVIRTMTSLQVSADNSVSLCFNHLDGFRCELIPRHSGVRLVSDSSLYYR